MICIFNKFFQQRSFVVVVVGDGAQLVAYNARFSSSYSPNQAIRTEIVSTSLLQQRASLKVKEQEKMM